MTDEVTFHIGKVLCPPRTAVDLNMMVGEVQEQRPDGPRVGALVRDDGDFLGWQSYTLVYTCIDCGREFTHFEHAETHRVDAKRLHTWRQRLRAMLSRWHLCKPWIMSRKGLRCAEESNHRACHDPR